MKRDWCKKRNTKKTTTACQILDVPTIDKITGLHITQVKNDGDSCVYGDPSAPVNPALQAVGSAIAKAFGSSVTITTGAGVIVRLQALPPGPEPKVEDHFNEIPPGLCDTPQLISGLNAASAICMGVENIAVVGDGKLVIITYLASGSSATHEQGAALGRAAAQRL